MQKFSYMNNRCYERQTTSLHAMKDRAIDFHKKLYLCEPLSAPLLDLNISFDNVITPEMGAWPHRYPTLEEVRKLIHGMSKGKTPGPDGMMVEVMVHHWECARMTCYISGFVLL